MISKRHGGKTLRRPSATPRGGGEGFAAPATAVPAGAAGSDAGTAAAAAPARQGWQAAIATTVAGMGYELVDVERAARGLLRVSIDRIPGRRYTLRHAPEQADDGEFVTVDDCEAVTRQLQYVLEVEGLDYARLEVSSPGLDRPLRSEADYRRFAGQPVALTLKAPLGNRKHFSGVLLAGEAEGGWRLVFRDGKTEQALDFTLQEVREARLQPVVDFKGRKAAGPAHGGGVAAPAPQTDGS